ncbi:MAG: hypothetical protein QOF09_4594 [Alphaproteobacteria bacterium]|jgi:hypothetical protein|nr:hypothetical protein [Alphaproteobacteria bacterium]
MATICTIEEDGNPTAVVSTFANLLLPGEVAAAMREGEWLWSALKGKPAPWDGKSLITARASTPIELGKYERNITEAVKDGPIDSNRHMAILTLKTQSHYEPQPGPLG